MSGVVIDLNGQIFGKWAVVRRAPSSARTTQAEWLCRCECGTEKVIASQMLRSGRSTQCVACYLKPIQVGDQVGKRTVVGKSGTGWKFKCNRCGTVTKQGRTMARKAACQVCDGETISPHSKPITVAGETHSLRGWARKTGLSSWTIQTRVRNGWDVARACTAPPNQEQTREALP